MEISEVEQRAIIESFRDLMQEISAKVSDAITPVCTMTMPVSVVVLEAYAQTLKSQPEFNNVLYAALKSDTHAATFVCDADDPEAAAAIKDFIREARGKDGRNR